MREVGDLGGFILGAMIAPEVILVERLHVQINWNNTGTRRIQCDCLHLLAGNTRRVERVARRRASEFM